MPAKQKAWMSLPQIIQFLPVIFMDRDPSLFRHLLQHLRHQDAGVLNALTSGGSMALRREFHFFHIAWNEYEKWP